MAKHDAQVRSWKPSHAEIHALLLRSDLLAKVPDTVVAKLALMAIPKGLAAGDVLWREGDQQYFAIAGRGQLEVRRDGKLIDTMLHGQAFGYSAFFGKAHTATMRASEDSHVLCFDAALLLDVALQTPHLAVALLADEHALIGKLSKDVASSRWQLRGQIHHRLAWLSRGRKNFTVRITQRQLAELTGSSYFSVNRELRKMENNGAIIRDFKGITIIDLCLDVDWQESRLSNANGRLSAPYSSSPAYQRNPSPRLTRARTPRPKRQRSRLLQHGIHGRDIIARS
jgi:CRP-like cAMP-binding protein